MPTRTCPNSTITTTQNLKQITNAYQLIIQQTIPYISEIWKVYCTISHNTITPTTQHTTPKPFCQPTKYPPSFAFTVNSIHDYDTTPFHSQHHTLHIHSSIGYNNKEAYCQSTALHQKSIHAVDLSSPKSLCSFRN